MEALGTEETTVLLRRAIAGDLSARDRVWTRLYGEVLLVAGAHRSRWTGDWTMETRVLAHEVFLKLFGKGTLSPKDRKHFFTVLSKAVRQILINYADARRAVKRGGAMEQVTLDDELGLALGSEVPDRVLDLHEALQRFVRLDPRAAKVVELKFFVGLTFDEVADALDVSRATAVRDWEAARAWLNRALGGAGARGDEASIGAAG